MKTPFYIIIILFLTFGALFAREKKSFNDYLSENNLDSTQVLLIDKKKLNQLLTSTEAKVTWVAIYTNYCGGTPYLFRDVKKAQRLYGNQLQIILCSSAPYKEFGGLIKVLKKDTMNLPAVYIIDSEVYKDKKSDDRVKGYKFRNDICESCRNDIIGVPYTILYNKNGKVLYGGYPGRTNFDSVLHTHITSKL
jgi:hypothetical protein